MMSDGYSLRDLRLVNLLRRRPRIGSVPLSTRIENRRRSEIERNHLETRDTESKSSLMTNLKIPSQHSSGRAKCVAASVHCEDFFILTVS